VAPAPARRRFAAGLAAGAALSLGLAWALLGAERREAAAIGEERLATVSAQALAELAARAWERREALPAAVEAFQAKARGVEAARVVVLSGARLEASTFEADAKAGPAPRRLAREEKPIFDRAQRLRAAVTGNREGAAAQAEIELERRGSGAVLAVAPLEVGGEVVGAATVESAAPATLGGRGAEAGYALAALAGALAAFALLSLAAGERRAALAVVALLALGGALAAFGALSVRSLRGASVRLEGAVAEHARAQAEAVAAALGAAGLDAAGVAPGRWDVDALRRPRARAGEAGDARVQAALAAIARNVARALALLGALGGALALFVGLGGADRTRRALVTHRQAYAYVAPAMVGMLVLVFFPFFYGIAISFTDQNIYNQGRSLLDIWTGVDNYAAILGDVRVVQRTAEGGLAFNYNNFYYTLLFTIVWTVTNVTFGVTFGLILALVLNTKGLALRPIYRVLLILPWAVPNYITALIWQGFFHQQFGVVNQAIQLFGGTPIAWFDRPFTSFLTAFATNGWLSFPFMMVVSLGALQSIPADVYEAARVDGASRLQQFRAITLPSLKPALVPAVILSVVWTFNMFNIIYLVTGGQPAGATEILVTQAYKYAFERYRYGYAAAYSTIIFGILLVYGTIQNRVSKATEAA
jgi:arabinogalactan oligomer/maltooligosaccharide transport system permease protein